MFFYKRNEEMQDLEHRILILEKRLEDYRKESKNARKELDASLTAKIYELEETKANKRVKKTK